MQQLQTCSFGEKLSTIVKLFNDSVYSSIFNLFHRPYVVTIKLLFNDEPDVCRPLLTNCRRKLPKAIVRNIQKMVHQNPDRNYQYR